MMFRKMALQNFKSWKNTNDIRLAPLTMLFGANSSGKSSLLQSILLMKQTVESTDRRLVLRTQAEPDGIIDLGTLREIIHNNGDTIRLEFEWQPPQDENDTGQRLINFSTQVKATGDAIFVENFNYLGDGRSVGMSRSENDSYKVNLTDRDGNPIKRARRGQPRAIPYPIKAYDFPSEASAQFGQRDAQILSDFALALEQQFERTRYLGPLREPPQRVYNWGGERPQDVGRRGELAIAAYLAMLDHEKDMKQRERGNSPAARVRYWFNEIHLLNQLEVTPIRKGGVQYEVKVRRENSSAEVLLTDVGFGVSQVLPIIVLCYYVEPGTTILLEQPELHLHPAVQSALADVFMDVIQNRGVQLIIESHSEHLLRRVQRRIAEGSFSSEQSALYFCAYDAQQSYSTIQELELNLFGEIMNWPVDFFGDALGEALETRKAALHRMKANGS